MLLSVCFWRRCRRSSRGCCLRRRGVRLRYVCVAFIADVHAQFEPLLFEFEKGFDEIEAAKKLGKVVAIPTVSLAYGKFENASLFLDLHKLLVDEYPVAHSLLKREIFSDYSLLYTWEGSDASLDPILFVSHTDVVGGSAASEVVLSARYQPAAAMPGSAVPLFLGALRTDTSTAEELST